MLRRSFELCFRRDIDNADPAGFQVRDFYRWNCSISLRFQIFGSRFPVLQTNALGACLFTIHNFTIRFCQTRFYVFMNESTGTLPHSRSFPLELYDSLFYYYIIIFTIIVIHGFSLVLLLLALGTRKPHFTLSVHNIFCCFLHALFFPLK